MSGTDIDVPETMHIEAETPDAPAVDRPKSAREITMEQIAARRMEALQRELGQGEVYDEDARAAGLTREDDVEPEPAPVVEARVVEPPTPAPVVAAPAAPALHTIQVDGRQFEVTPAQYAELARLGMVANVALHQYQQPTPEPVAVPAPLVDPNYIRETVKKIQYGGEEDATEALAGLIAQVARNAAPAVDQEAIIQRAVAQSQAKIAERVIHDTITTEFADIMVDPVLKRAAAIEAETIRYRAGLMGVAKSDLDIYREAGNAVRMQSRPSVEPSPSALQAAPTVSRQDTIERKRAAPRATSGIDRRATPPETPRPPSNAELVARMRQARGQSPLN